MPRWKPKLVIDPVLEAQSRVIEAARWIDSLVRAESTGDEADDGVWEAAHQELRQSVAALDALLDDQ